MPDVKNVKFYSATSSVTFIQITNYAFTPRTDRQATHGLIDIFLDQGPNTGLYTHSTDLAFGRKVVGTVNGHSIGEHIIKRHNLDRWELGANYTFRIEFDIPYSPGAVYINLQIVPEGAGNAKYMQTSTFTTGTNQYTVSSGAGLAPVFNRTPTLNAQGAWIFGDINVPVTLAWDAATPGTGAVQGYYVYWSENGSNWNYKGQTAGLSYTLYPNQYPYVRGKWIWYLVSAIGLYGTSSAASYPGMQMAYAPSAVAALTVTPDKPRPNSEHTLSWVLPAANSGEIKAVELEVRHKPKGGAWSEWVGLIGLGAVTSHATSPSAYAAAYKPLLGSVLQFRIRVKNTYDVYSDYTLSREISYSGGIIRLNIGGTWKEGIAYVNVGGIWKEASSVHVNVGGTWKESA